MKMAIDVKKIQVEAHRVTEFSITYVKKYPIIPATIAFLLPLYVFLPSLFVFLVFLVPIFISIAVAFRLIFHIHQQNLRNAKGTHEVPARKLTPSKSDRNLNKRGYSNTHAQSVRRRNSKKHELRVHFEDDPVEKDIIFPTVNENPLVNKTALIEVNTKEIRVVEAEPMNEKSNSDEDEEEAPENRNKAVEWTEDDQKNLMDLGFSEMERNKRLESLIAKRKARKLLSLQVRRTLMNIGKTEPSNEISSILIPKSGDFSRTKSGEAEVSPIPGSAPSVLLPVHKPFDLPYDPQEEKPNLVDGFQEELVDNHHNDTVFCRHESFSLGAFSPRPWELDPSPNESNQRPDFEILPKIQEIPQFLRFENQSGKDDPGEIMETETSQEQSKAPENALDLNTKEVEGFSKDDINVNGVDSGNGTKKFEYQSKLDTDDIDESILSSSSDINAPFSNANRDEILRSLSFSVRKNIPNDHIDVLSYHENPSSYEKRVGNDPFFNSIHTRRQCMASDFQVEVSEVGLQVTNLSSDGDSPKYDVDEEKEGNFGKEEVWVAESQLKRVEENEARSRQVPKDSSDSVEKFLADKQIVYNINDQVEEIEDHNNVEKPEQSSNSVENFLADKKIVYGIELVHDDQGIIDFIQDTYGQDVETINQNSVNIIGGNSTQPENQNSNSNEHVAKGTDFTGNNNSQDRGIAAEKGPEEASSSTYPRSTTNDKDQSSESKSSASNDIVGTSEFNPALARPTEPVMVLGIEPTPIAAIPEAVVEQATAHSSSSSSPNSVLQHKFSVDLATSISFDDIHLASLLANAEVEPNGISQENSATEELSIPQSHSTEEKMELAVNDRAANHVTGDEIVETSADTGLLTRTEKNEKIETIEGVETFEKKQTPKELDFLAKDSTADKPLVGNSADLQKSPSSFNPPTVENTSSSVNHGTINKAMENELLQTSDNRADIGSLTSTKKNETRKGVEAQEELQSPKEFDGHSKLDDTVDEAINAGNS